MILEFRNVELKQNEQTILTGVDFSVDSGDFVFLTGKVGSGKSTLLSAIYAELTPSSGYADVLGYDMLSIKQKQVTLLRKQLGIVFQSFELLPDRTVYGNLAFVLKATGWKNVKEVNARIQEVLSKVEMLDKTDAYPFELSGGEQQRVAIARALLNDPELIVADEPTGNLDEDTATDILNLLMKINSESGTAIIMVTHNREICRRYPGRIFEIKDEACTEITPAKENSRENNDNSNEAE